MKKPSKFEIKVIKLAVMLATGKKSPLWNQIDSLYVKKRTITGCGFYTDFWLEKNTDGFRGEMTDPASINARKKYPKDGLVFFILWTDAEGCISQLEAVSAEDCLWPDNIFCGFYDFQDDNGNLIDESIVDD